MTTAERAAVPALRVPSGYSGPTGVAARLYRHPVNRAVFSAAPFGARLADRVTGFMGSWRFIAIQSGIVLIWLAANIILLTRPFDPFPFILLNLAFSTQAAYAAPLILLATNRASQRDRLTLEHAAEEGDLGDAQNERLLTGNVEILSQLTGLEVRIHDLEQAILRAIKVARPMDEAAANDTSRIGSRGNTMWKMLFHMPIAEQQSASVAGRCAGCDAQVRGREAGAPTLCVFCTAWAQWRRQGDELWARALIAPEDGRSSARSRAGLLAGRPHPAAPGS